MEHSSDHCWLAIATLEVPRRILDALDELDANRFASHDLCLAGTAAALHQVRSALPGDHVPYRSLLEVEPLSLLASHGINATSKRLLTSLKAPAGPGSDRGASSGCWLMPDLRAGLLDRMSRGDIMLVAGPVGAEQMQVGTRVLLRHSSHPVQSHMIAGPRPQ